MLRVPVPFRPGHPLHFYRRAIHESVSCPPLFFGPGHDQLTGAVLRVTAAGVQSDEIMLAALHPQGDTIVVSFFNAPGDELRYFAALKTI
jgi:hypothetical protein